MRRTILLALAVAGALAAGGCAAHTTASEAAGPAPQAAPAHQHAAAAPSAGAGGGQLADQLAKARLATGRYVTSLHQARPTATRSSPG
jgi:hypothetical protein